MRKLLDSKLLEPLIVVLALVVAGGLYAAGNSQVARLLLLLVTAVGTLPFVWSMVKSIAQKEYGIDILAVTAITASLLLGEYVAGGIILLMLTTGEALEEYAQGRAQRELTSLLEHAPKIAHRKVKLWG